jgi:hypothetical protein
MSDTNRQEHMRELVAEWRSSGMSQKAFAKEHKLNLHTFKYWLYKFRQQNDGSGNFIRLDHITAKEICLRYPNGVELLVPAQTPASTLRELIKFAG